MPGEYTLAALAASVAVVGLELVLFRTGLFREARYWVTVAIVFGFQLPVDGWLTHRSAPVVSYNEAETSGLRFPADIPVEDFAFGFALVTLTLLLWRRQQLRAWRAREAPAGNGARVGCRPPGAGHA
jgi:lycopene cyclase domain-containing protein